MIIISMAVWGTMSIFVRNIAVSSSELALYRAVLASTMIGLYLLITKQEESMTIMQIIGGIFILGFTLHNEIPTKKKHGN